MEFLTKITTKKIGVQPARGKAPEIGTLLAVATLIGIARSYTAGESEYGAFLKFAGDFEAVRMSDGEVFRSARLILPPIIADQLQTAVDADADKGGVQFALELGIKGSDNQVGYEWAVRPLGKLSGTADPLAALREEAQKALPAPEKDAHEKGKGKGK